LFMSSVLALLLRFALYLFHFASLHSFTFVLVYPVL
jgi:hypothetical protein